MRHLLTLSLVAALPANAAVTLAEAYQQALAKTEPVAIQKALTQQADERITQVFGAVFPRLSVLGSYRYQDPIAAAGGATSAFTRPDQYSLAINVTQPIFRGLGEWAELRSRRATHAASEFRVQTAHLVLYRNVADAYFAVLAEERDCKNLEELIALAEKQVRELRQRVSIGRSRIGDRLAAESRAAALRAELTGRRSVLAAAREGLKAVTTLSVDTELVMADGVPTEPPPLEPLLADLEKRPDYEAAKRDVEAADESIAVAQSVYWPQIDAAANYYITRTGVLAGSHWDAGVTLTWPIFAGGTQTAAVRERVEARKTTELSLAQLRRAAEQEIRTAHAASLLAVQQERELQEAMSLSAKNYEQQLRDYRNGLVTNLDVLNALRDLSETRRGHDRLLFEAQMRRVQLDVASGRLPHS